MGTLSLVDIDEKLNAVSELLEDASTFRTSSYGLTLLQTSIRACLLVQQPLSFLSYWGIGSKLAPGEPEKRALNFEIETLGRIAGVVGLPWQLEYIITDTHALINGRAQEVIDSYSRSVARWLEMRGCKCLLMTELLRNLGVSLGLDDGVAKAMELQWAQLRHERKKELIRLASRHCSGSDKEEAAARYYISNIVEGSLIGRFRSSSIFVTYMLPAMAFLLPPLPCIYIYVNGGRDVRRPWFVQE